LCEKVREEREEREEIRKEGKEIRKMIVYFFRNIFR
jgi:hypothetical protein